MTLFPPMVMLFAIGYLCARSDAVHPIILGIHLGFWLPWPILGAVTGARAPRPATR